MAVHRRGKPGPAQPRNRGSGAFLTQLTAGSRSSHEEVTVTGQGEQLVGRGASAWDTSHHPLVGTPFGGGPGPCTPHSCWSGPFLSVPPLWVPGSLGRLEGRQARLRVTVSTLRPAPAPARGALQHLSERNHRQPHLTDQEADEQP